MCIGLYIFTYITVIHLHTFFLNTIKVKKIVLNIKDKPSSHDSYNVNGTVRETISLSEQFYSVDKL